MRGKDIFRKDKDDGMNEDEGKNVNSDEDEDNDSDKYSDNLKEEDEEEEEEKLKGIYILKPCSILVKRMIERPINYALLKAVKDKSA